MDQHQRKKLALLSHDPEGWMMILDAPASHKQRKGSGP